jgi:hypothetical protein
MKKKSGLLNIVAICAITCALVAVEGIIVKHSWPIVHSIVHICLLCGIARKIWA